MITPENRDELSITLEEDLTITTTSTVGPLSDHYIGIPDIGDKWTTTVEEPPVSVPLEFITDQHRHDYQQCLVKAPVRLSDAHIQIPLYRAELLTEYPESLSIHYDDYPSFTVFFGAGSGVVTVRTGIRLGVARQPYRDGGMVGVYYPSRVADIRIELSSHLRKQGVELIGGSWTVTDTDEIVVRLRLPDIPDDDPRHFLMGYGTPLLTLFASPRHQIQLTIESTP